MLNLTLSLLRLKKLGYALKSSLLRRALRFGVAASIEHRKIFAASHYATVVDIGANKGQFAVLARDLWPEATIESFEPINSCAKIFREVFVSDGHTRLHEMAVGPESTTASIYVTNASDSSSLLPPGELQEKIFGTKTAQRQDVAVQPLEAVLRARDIIRPALLKIDVQGFELAALQGCISLLQSFDEIYVECSYVELYKDQALASEIVSFLERQDFNLHGVFNQHIDKEKGALQADFLFTRSAHT
jgi:FkbM family methyltransferase